MQYKGIFQLFLALGIITTLLAGCSKVDASSTKKNNEVQVSGEANGQKIVLKQGQAFTVRLESNITTGYSWEIGACDPAVLKLDGEPVYEESQPNQQRVGAGGWQAFHFKPVKAGQTSLKLIYHRPWEKDKEPIQTFEVQITVE